MSATGRPVRVLCVYCIGASLAGAAKQWTVRDLPCPYEDRSTDTLAWPVDAQHVQPFVCLIYLVRILLQ